MPGYSGASLPKKLGIKDGLRVAFFCLPEDVGRDLDDVIAKCEISKARLDFVMIFVKTQGELRQQFIKFSQQLAPAGMLWVSWPKKSSGVPTDLDENSIRDFGLEAGLVDVKVCAVTGVWSGLKFVIRLKDRTPSGKT